MSRMSSSMASMTAGNALLTRPMHVVVTQQPSSLRSCRNYFR
eukprot:CAMPEP_0184383970 /NCGR_PEP_ID=MMETSP0007-20130409/7550_1 /TAXON_ID=97485 /ORGANISM="Prymnesium parvum, Strain Texoma1" /LENGTH=41 /DNA_ID= /DNA_START= /DNA_END= /DNA_ORIENTATION=